MSGKLHVLQSPEVGKIARSCPLLENQADREAWVACCTKRFLPVARRIAGDNMLVEDALQESWIRVLLHVCEYRGDPPACAWVRAIVRNCTLDARKNHHRAVGTGDLPSSIEDPSLTPEEHLAQRELRDLLHEMIAALPDMYREVCTLHFEEGYTVAETAGQLGITPSSASTRLARAVRRLQRVSGGTR